MNFIDDPGGCSQRTYIKVDGLPAKGNQMPGMKQVSAQLGRSEATFTKLRHMYCGSQFAK